ncbi:MAG: DUF3592 domain-containing protein [Phototrophicaceae bacterium]
MAKLEQTEGTVLSTAIGSGQSRYKGSSGGYKYRTSYFPDISYRYTVDGNDYINNGYAQRTTLINRTGMIQRILDKYPTDSTVTVYYNPHNPQESYLEKGYGSTITFLLIAIVVFVIAITIIMIVVLNGLI